VARWMTTTQGMVGLIRMDAEVQIRATAVMSSNSGLAGSLAPASLDQREGRVC
jgi:hypothetical protein